MDISVIIVNYNTCQLTKNCLDSIYEFTKDVFFEVIVVDNDSTDGSKEMLASYPGIVYIQSGKNLGFGKANNLGYKHSSGRYVLLLNSDTLLKNNAIAEFVWKFDKLRDSIGCVGSKLLTNEGGYNHSFQKFPTLKTEFVNLLELYLRPFNYRGYHLNELDYITNADFLVEYITGADLCIRKSVIERCGLFDPDFFMYFEETEMQYRYHQFGYSSCIIDTPKIVHLESASSKPKSFKNRYMFYTSNILYMKKCSSFIHYLLFRFIFFLRFPMFFASYYTFSQSFQMLKLAISPAKKNRL